MRRHPGFELALGELRSSRPNGALDTMRDKRDAHAVKAGEHPSKRARSAPAIDDFLPDLDAWFRWRAAFMRCNARLLCIVGLAPFALACAGHTPPSGGSPPGSRPITSASSGPAARNATPHVPAHARPTKEPATREPDAVDGRTTEGEALTSEAAPEVPPPVLPDCEDDGAETDPGCLWKRFEIIRKKPDVKVAFTLVDEGCGLADHLLPGLKRFARSPLVAVRAARWVHSMSNHCRSEIPSCGIDGTVTWKGYTIELHINHEGRGAVFRGDESDAFAILGEGSCSG